MLEIPVFSIVGCSGSGKTTLLEKLVAELKRRGCRVAVIKHHPESGLVLDEPGKDTWRLARAGADQVVFATPDRVVHHIQTETEWTLQQVVANIRGVDLVLTEGFKKEHMPKVEIVRKEMDCGLVSRSDERIAVVSDRLLEVTVPQFHLEDVNGLADLLLALASRGKSQDPL